MNKKVGIWIVLILTSLALVVPSLSIIYSLFFSESSVSQSYTVTPEDVSISVETAAPAVEEISYESVSLSTQESPR